MRAAVFDRYGPPEVLRIADVERPAPREGEVLVRVHATSINGGEVQGRAGRLRLVLGNRFPQRSGIDLVGEVAGLGSGVDGYRQGDRVWGLNESPIGTTAEYFAIDQHRISRAPVNLRPEEAVTLLAGGTTAITALRDKAHLQCGERLLIRGAAGGVGSIAVQIGHHCGAHVTALARTQNLDFVRGLGADEVVDYTRTSLSALGEFDVILDSAGSDHRQLRTHLSASGRMVAVTIDMQRRVASLGYLAASVVHGRRRVRVFRGRPHTALLEELARLAEQGIVKPVVHEVFPLEGVVDAHRALEAGGVEGKVVIRIA